VNLTRAQLESKGLALREPTGRRILEVPADFGWDDQSVEYRAAILKIFGFVGNKGINTKRRVSYQISQDE
jgi:hypothetical protein